MVLVRMAVRRAFGIFGTFRVQSFFCFDKVGEGLREWVLDNFVHGVFEKETVYAIWIEKQRYR